MTRKTSTLVFGTCMLLAPGVGRAQDADPFLVGNRVRVTLDSSQAAVKGRVLASDADTLTLLAGDQPLKISRSRITGAETSIGRRSAWLKGAAIGTGLGLLLGVALPVDPSCSSVFDDPRTARPCTEGAVHSRGEGIATGALGGAIWGAVIGHFVRRDVWTPLHLEHVHVSVGRKGAAVSFSF